MHKLARDYEELCREPEMDSSIQLTKPVANMMMDPNNRDQPSTNMAVTHTLSLTEDPNGDPAKYQMTVQVQDRSGSVSQAGLDTTGFNTFMLMRGLFGGMTTLQGQSVTGQGSVLVALWEMRRRFSGFEMKWMGQMSNQEWGMSYLRTIQSGGKMGPTMKLGTEFTYNDAQQIAALKWCFFRKDPLLDLSTYAEYSQSGQMRLAAIKKYGEASVFSEVNNHPMPGMMPSAKNRGRVIVGVEQGFVDGSSAKVWIDSAYHLCAKLTLSIGQRGQVGLGYTWDAAQSRFRGGFSLSLQ